MFSTHVPALFLDTIRWSHSHSKTSHSVEGSTESANCSKDNSEPSLLGTAEVASTRISLLGFRLLCKIFPRFFPNMQWLLISLRISGSALSMLVELTNGIPAAEAAMLQPGWVGSIL